MKLTEKLNSVLEASTTYKADAKKATKKIDKELDKIDKQMDSSIETIRNLIFDLKGIGSDANRAEDKEFREKIRRLITIIDGGAYFSLKQGRASIRSRSDYMELLK